MPSLFSKIVAGEVPAYCVAEDDRFYAFLDIFPIAKGHTLVIPKMEVDYLFDLDDQTLGDLHIFAKRVAKGIELVVPCERIGTAVVGLEVPHAHVHLIPLHGELDLDFSRPKLEFTKAEFTELAAAIAGAIS